MEVLKLLLQSLFLLYVMSCMLFRTEKWSLELSKHAVAHCHHWIFRSKHSSSAEPYPWLYGYLGLFSLLSASQMKVSAPVAAYLGNLFPCGIWPPKYSNLDGAVIPSLNPSSAHWNVVPLVGWCDLSSCWGKFPAVCGSWAVFSSSYKVVPPLSSVSTGKWISLDSL